MKHRIAQIIFVAFMTIITCILLFGCSSKPIKAESSHAELYELYVNEFGSNSGLTFYNNYKVKPENIHTIEKYGNLITTYHATDGTQITFANNGITIISPKGHRESFTQGYMRRIGDNV